MAGFKSPDFNERVAAAGAAKQRALDLLRSKPAPDPAVVAAQQAAQSAREEAQAERRRARLAEIEAAKAARAAKAVPVAAPAAVKPAAPERVALTPEEQKAARDARYALRKARKR